MARSRSGEIGKWHVALHEHDDVALPWLAEASDDSFTVHHESPRVDEEAALRGIAEKIRIDLAELRQVIRP